MRQVNVMLQPLAETAADIEAPTDIQPELQPELQPEPSPNPARTQPEPSPNPARTQSEPSPNPARIHSEYPALSDPTVIIHWVNWDLEYLQVYRRNPASKTAALILLGSWDTKPSAAEMIQHLKPGSFIAYRFTRATGKQAFTTPRPFEISDAIYRQITGARETTQPMNAAQPLTLADLDTLHAHFSKLQAESEERIIRRLQAANFQAAPAPAPAAAPNDLTAILLQDVIDRAKRSEERYNNLLEKHLEQQRQAPPPPPPPQDRQPFSPGAGIQALREIVNLGRDSAGNIHANGPALAEAVESGKTQVGKVMDWLDGILEEGDRALDLAEKAGGLVKGLGRIFGNNDASGSFTDAIRHDSDPIESEPEFTTTRPAGNQSYSEYRSSIYSHEPNTDEETLDDL